MENQDNKEVLEEKKLTDEQTEEADGGRGFAPHRVCPVCGKAMTIAHNAKYPDHKW